MAKKTEKAKLVPTYGFMVNEEGTIDLITITYNPESEEVEIDRETQGYTEEYRALYDIQSKLAKNFMSKGKK